LPADPELVFDGPTDASMTITLAHGAGAGMEGYGEVDRNTWGGEGRASGGTGQGQRDLRLKARKPVRKSGPLGGYKALGQVQRG
jgi:hypothetical protein